MIGYGDRTTKREGQIEDNMEEVRATIARAAARAGRDPDAVTVVAITKGFPTTTVLAAAEAGLHEIGENRVQEAMEKRNLLGDLPDVRWHLVGHLQRNKARHALLLFDVIHSVDSVRLARTLQRRAEQEAREEIPIFLEVNVAGEESKYGFHLKPEGDFFAAVEAILDLSHLRLEGLMTVAPMVADPEEVRPVFRRLHRLRETLRQRYPQAPWTHLSMGMTDDYEVAVEEGATMLRLGRALFGPRRG